MNILLTGAGGFIGRHVAGLLPTDRLLAHLGPKGTPCPPQVQSAKTFTADITDRDAFQYHLRDIDTLIHVAGPPSVAESFAQPYQYVAAHMLGTTAVLEAARTAGVTHVVYVSSAEVYGQPTTAVVSEESPLNPQSPYGAAKMGAESVLRTMAGDGSFSAVVLRPFSVYGVREKQQGVLAVILRQLNNDTVKLQAPHVVRDFCHVTDVAQAIVTAANHRGWNDTFNVGSGIGTSIEELTNVVSMEANNRTLPIELVPSDRPENLDVQVLISDTRKIKTALNWSPQTPLKAGIKQLLLELSCEI